MMPLIPGDPTCTTGFASEIHAAMLADIGVDSAALKAMCYTLATTICSHITTHATVLPTAMIAPSGGGAVTGAGTVT